MLRLLLRALATDLQRIVVRTREQERLSALGIEDPALQRFFAWRRSVFLFVIVVTTASAVLNTINDNYAHDDPVHDISVRLDAHDDVALPVEPRHTRFRDLADSIMGVLLYALPLSALAAMLTWTRWRRSRRLLMAGWLIGFLVPMMLALAPLRWWQPDPSNLGLDFLYSVVYGLQWFLLLLPTVLSLLPGMVRACLRIKTLLPESIIAGWILVAAAPFYSLLLLVVWVAICHLLSDGFLLWGVLLWIATPLVYVWHGRVLTRPMIDETDLHRFRRIQLYANILWLLSMIFLTVFVFTVQVMGIRLIGMDSSTSLFRPWVAVQYMLEYWGRSLFVTALAADFFMRVNRAIWKTSREFAGTPEAEDYDRLMHELEVT